MLKLIPRSVLFGNPSRVSPRISPDGKRMSYVAPDEGVLNVWVGTPGENDDHPVTRDRDRGIAHYFWAHDNRRILYLQDVGGNENWRLYAVELDTLEIRDLTPFENVQVQIIDHNKKFPDQLLIGMNKDREEVHDVYHLNLLTGLLQIAAKNPGNVAGWTTDAGMKVRGAVVTTEDGGSDLLVRDSEDAEWRRAARWEADDALDSG